MIGQVIENKVLIEIIVAICGLSIILKAAIAFRYGHLIKEADDMGNSNNKFLKKIKHRFSKEYDNSYSVNNVGVFVDKYMYQMKIMGFKPSVWEGFGTFILVLCLLLGSLGALWSYENGTERDVTIYIIAAVVSAGALVLIDSLINTQRRREHLHVNMCCYLENRMKPKLENGENDFDIGSFSKLSDEIDEGMMSLINSMNSEKEDKDKKIKRNKEKNNQMINISKGEQKIVEDVIKEYLT